MDAVLNDKRKFGELAISMGFVSSSQVGECLRIQTMLPNHKLLGVIMMEKGYLSQKQISGIVQNQQISDDSDEEEDDDDDLELEEIEEIEEIEDSLMDISSVDIDSQNDSEIDSQNDNNNFVGELELDDDSDDDSDVIEDGIPINLGYSNEEDTDFESDNNNILMLEENEESDVEDAVVLDVENNEVFNVEPLEDSEVSVDAFDTGDNSPFGANDNLSVGDDQNPFGIDSANDNAFDMGENNPFGANDNLSDGNDQNPFGIDSANDNAFDMGENNPPDNNNAFDMGENNPFGANDNFSAGNDQNPFGVDDNTFDMAENDQNPFGNNNSFDMEDPFSTNDNSAENDPNSFDTANSNPFDIGGNNQNSDNMFDMPGQNDPSFDFFGHNNNMNQVSPEEDATISEEAEGSVDLFSQSSIDKITTGEDITLNDNNFGEDIFAHNPLADDNPFALNQPNQFNRDTEPLDPFNPKNAGKSNSNFDMNDFNGMPLDLESSGNMPAQDTYGIKPLGDAIDIENSINQNDFDPFSTSDPTISYENMLTSEPTAVTQEWDWGAVNNNQNFPSNTDIESDFFNPPDLQSNIRPPQEPDFGNNQPGGFHLPNISTDDATIAAPMNAGMNPQPFAENLGTFPPTSSPFPQTQSSPPPMDKFSPQTKPSSARRSAPSKRIPQNLKVSRPSGRISRARNRRETSLSSNEIKILYAILIFCMVVLIAVVLYVIMSNNNKTDVGEENNKEVIVAQNDKNIKDKTVEEKKIDLEEIYQKVEVAIREAGVDNIQANKIVDEQLQTAISNLDSIIRVDSSYKEALYYRALCYFVKDNYYDAQINADKALKITTKKKECLYILAVCLKQKKEFAEALDLCNQSLEEDSTFLYAKNLKCDLLKEKGELLASLKYSLQINNLSKVQSARLAVMRVITENKASFDISDVLEIDKQYPPFYAQLAWQSLQRNEPTKAYQALSKKFELEKSNQKKELSFEDILVLDLYFYSAYKTLSDYTNLEQEIKSIINNKQYYSLLPPLSIYILTAIKLKKYTVADDTEKRKTKRELVSLFILAMRALEFIEYYSRPQSNVSPQIYTVLIHVMKVLHAEIAPTLEDDHKKYYNDMQFLKYTDRYYTLNVVVERTDPGEKIQEKDVLTRMGETILFTSKDFYIVLNSPDIYKQNLFFIRGSGEQSVPAKDVYNQLKDRLVLIHYLTVK